eukprot:Rmarinus@m.9231
MSQVTLCIRPQSTYTNHGGSRTMLQTSDNKVELLHPLRSKQVSVPFSTILDEVEEPVAELHSIWGVEAALNVADGVSYMLMAAGPRGSGKSHIMRSPDGLIERTVETLFSNLDSLSCSYRVEVQVVALTGEVFSDLLRNGAGESHQPVVRENRRVGVLVDNATRVRVSSSSECQHLLRESYKRTRTLESPQNNDCDVTLAAVLTVLRQIPAESESGKNMASSVYRLSRLLFVDVAGARVGDRKSARAKAASRAWTQLSLCVGACSAAAAKSQLTSHTKVRRSSSLSSSTNSPSSPRAQAEEGIFWETTAPFRDSALTYIMKDCLWGPGLAAMIICVSPWDDDHEETCATLRFAENANDIHPIVPAVPLEFDRHRLISDMTNDVHDLRVKLTNQQLGPTKGKLRLEEAKRSLLYVSRMWDPNARLETILCDTKRSRTPSRVQKSRYMKSPTGQSPSSTQASLHVHSTRKISSNATNRERAHSASSICRSSSPRVPRASKQAGHITPHSSHGSDGTGPHITPHTSHALTQKRSSASSSLQTPPHSHSEPVDHLTSSSCQPGTDNVLNPQAISSRAPAATFNSENVFPFSGSVPSLGHASRTHRDSAADPVTRKSTYTHDPGDPIVPSRCEADCDCCGGEWSSGRDRNNASSGWPSERISEVSERVQRKVSAQVVSATTDPDDAPQLRRRRSGSTELYRSRSGSPIEYTSRHRTSSSGSPPTHDTRLEDSDPDADSPDNARARSGPRTPSSSLAQSLAFLSPANKVGSRGTQQADKTPQAALDTLEGLAFTQQPWREKVNQLQDSSSLPDQSANPLSAVYYADCSPVQVNAHEIAREDGLPPILSERDEGGLPAQTEECVREVEVCNRACLRAGLPYSFSLAGVVPIRSGDTQSTAYQKLLSTLATDAVESCSTKALENAREGRSSVTIEGDRSTGTEAGSATQEAGELLVLARRGHVHVELWSLAQLRLFARSLSYSTTTNASKHVDSKVVQDHRNFSENFENNSQSTSETLREFTNGLLDNTPSNNSPRTTLSCDSAKISQSLHERVEETSQATIPVPTGISISNEKVSSVDVVEGEAPACVTISANDFFTLDNNGGDNVVDRETDNTEADENTVYDGSTVCEVSITSAASALNCADSTTTCMHEAVASENDPVSENRQVAANSDASAVVDGKPSDIQIEKADIFLDMGPVDDKETFQEIHSVISPCRLIVPEVSLESTTCSEIQKIPSPRSDVATVASAVDLDVPEEPTITRVSPAAMLFCPNVDDENDEALELAFKNTAATVSFQPSMDADNARKSGVRNGASSMSKEDAAATTIQRVVRGYMVRKVLRELRTTKFSVQVTVRHGSALKIASAPARLSDRTDSNTTGGVNAFVFVAVVDPEGRQDAGWMTHVVACNSDPVFNETHAVDLSLLDTLVFTVMHTKCPPSPDEGENKHREEKNEAIGQASIMAKELLAAHLVDRSLSLGGIGVVPRNPLSHIPFLEHAHCGVYASQSHPAMLSVRAVCMWNAEAVGTWLFPNRPWPYGGRVSHVRSYSLPDSQTRSRTPLSSSQLSPICSSRMPADPPALFLRPSSPDDEENANTDRVVATPIMSPVFSTAVLSPRGLRSRSVSSSRNALQKSSSSPRVESSGLSPKFTGVVATSGPSVWVGCSSMFELDHSLGYTPQQEKFDAILEIQGVSWMRRKRMSFTGSPQIHVECDSRRGTFSVTSRMPYYGSYSLKLGSCPAHVDVDNEAYIARAYLSRVSGTEADVDFGGRVDGDIVVVLSRISDGFEKRVTYTIFASKPKLEVEWQCQSHSGDIITATKTFFSCATGVIR